MEKNKYISEDLARYLRLLREGSPRGGVYSKLAERAKSQTEQADRSKSVLLLGLLGYRRAAKLVFDFIRQWDADPISGEFPFIQHCCSSLAFLDFEQSHAYLKSVALGSKTDYLRIDAIEKLGYEKKLFDLSVIVEILNGSGPPMERMAALWAISQQVIPENFEFFRDDIVTNIHDNSPNVRGAAVEILYFSNRAEDRALIVSLLDDHEKCDFMPNTVSDFARESLELYDGRHPVPSSESSSFVPVKRALA